MGDTAGRDGDHVDSVGPAGSGDERGSTRSSREKSVVSGRNRKLDGGVKKKKQRRRKSRPKKRSAAAEFILGLFGCGRTVSPPSSPELSPGTPRVARNGRERLDSLQGEIITVLGPPPPRPVAGPQERPAPRARFQSFDVAMVHQPRPKEEFHSLPPPDKMSHKKRRRRRRSVENNSSSGGDDARAKSEETYLLSEAPAPVHRASSVSKSTATPPRRWLETRSDLLPEARKSSSGCCSVGGRRRQRAEEEERRRKESMGLERKPVSRCYLASKWDLKNSSRANMTRTIVVRPN